MNYTAVITTINQPTKAVKEFAKRIPLIVIGDEKTPKDWKWHDVMIYYDDFSYYSYRPPVNHYARKNLGYLHAMQSGADCIYDTDDDNIPNDNWKLRERGCNVRPVIESAGWVNVYKNFTRQIIWPRGLPLPEIDNKAALSDECPLICPIQQGLSDKSPDVDAIWRLLHGYDVNFKEDRSIFLHSGTWSPFNSQTTWWFKEAFPLMYLPQYCTMRMTDIIRSFVAQRCLWEMGYGVVFHSPSEVVQERNEHDLMKDFEDEIQGYLMNDKIKITLDGATLRGATVIDNMIICYGLLIGIGILPEKELDSLAGWVNDIKKIWKP